MTKHEKTPMVEVRRFLSGNGRKYIKVVMRCPVCNKEKTWARYMFIMEPKAYCDGEKQWR